MSARARIAGSAKLAVPSRADPTSAQKFMAGRGQKQQQLVVVESDPESESEPKPKPKQPSTPARSSVRPRESVKGSTMVSPKSEQSNPTPSKGQLNGQRGAEEGGNIDEEDTIDSNPVNDPDSRQIKGRVMGETLALALADGQKQPNEQGSKVPAHGATPPGRGEKRPEPAPQDRRPPPSVPTQVSKPVANTDAKAAAATPRSSSLRALQRRFTKTTAPVPAPAPAPDIKQSTDAKVTKPEISTEPIVIVVDSIEKLEAPPFDIPRLGELVKFNQRPETFGDIYRLIVTSDEATAGAPAEQQKGGKKEGSEEVEVGEEEVLPNPDEDSAIESLRMEYARKFDNTEAAIPVFVFNGTFWDLVFPECDELETRIRPPVPRKWRADELKDDDDDFKEVGDDGEYTVETEVVNVPKEPEKEPVGITRKELEDQQQAAKAKAAAKAPAAAAAATAEETVPSAVIHHGGPPIHSEFTISGKFVWTPCEIAIQALLRRMLRHVVDRIRDAVKPRTLADADGAYRYYLEYSEINATSEVDKWKADFSATLGDIITMCASEYQYCEVRVPGSTDAPDVYVPEDILVFTPLHVQMRTLALIADLIRRDAEKEEKMKEEKTKEKEKGEDEEEVEVEAEEDDSKSIQFLVVISDGLKYINELAVPELGAEAAIADEREGFFNWGHQPDGAPLDIVKDDGRTLDDDETPDETGEDASASETEDEKEEEEEEGEEEEEEEDEDAKAERSEKKKKETGRASYLDVVQKRVNHLVETSKGGRVASGWKPWTISPFLYDLPKAIMVAGSACESMSKEFVPNAPACARIERDYRDRYCSKLRGKDLEPKMKAIKNYKLADVVAQKIAVETVDAFIKFVAANKDMFSVK